MKTKCDNCLIGMRWCYESVEIHEDAVKTVRGALRLALQGYKDRFNTYELFEACPRCGTPVDREALDLALKSN